jgi:hypothetical protein
MKLMLLGVEVALASVTALFFVRSWQRTGDRFFALFAAAFAALAVNWLGLAATDRLDESRTYFFWLRLGSLFLILVAIWDKNRSRTMV